MSIHIGDNFKYLGKKFLDDRESFATIAEMKACQSVPDGFITYCREDEKRYEFKSSNTINELTGKWTEFVVNVSNNGGSNGGTDTPQQPVDPIPPVVIGECDCTYMGEDEPDDTDKIWFLDDSNVISSGVTYENPLIEELFAIIQSMQNQITQLQADVEYLKLNGGGGIPIEPPGGGGNEPGAEGVIFFSLEDGSGFFDLEDGSGCMILEETITVVKDETLLLEDGSCVLLEDGSYMLLE